LRELHTLTQALHAVCMPFNPYRAHHEDFAPMELATVKTTTQK
jgi:hypothetical protein